MSIRWFIGWLSIATASAAAQEIELPNEFEAGQPARAAEVNANFEALKDAVSENASALAELQPSEPPPPPLAFELNGATELNPLRGAAGGGRQRTSGGLLEPRPLVLHGLPGEISELVRMLAEGRRFNLRVLHLTENTAQALIALDTTRVRSLRVPAVGRDATERFQLSITFDEGEAGLGPFEAESVTPPARGTPFEPGLELVLPTEGVAIAPIAVEVVEVRRNSGGRIVATNAVMSVASADADPLLDAFTGGLVLTDPTLRYLATDGAPVLEVTADRGTIVAAAPGFTGDAVTVELAFETSASSGVRVSAP